MQIDEAISDFWMFLKNPKYAWKQDNPIPFVTMTMLYAMVFLVILFVSSPLMYIVGVENMEHAVDDLIKNYPKWMFVLLTVVLAPLIEELIFRLHLNQPLLFPALLFALFSGALYAVYSASYLALWPTIIIGLFLIALSILLFSSESFRSGISNFYRHRFAWVFYVTAFVFALAHISNFSDLDRWYVAPVLVLPQAMIGLFLGYIRVRNNIFWSIYFHAFHNMIPTLLFLFVPMDI